MQAAATPGEYASDKSSWFDSGLVAVGALAERFA
jgi:hypothetical protein